MQSPKHHYITIMIQVMWLVTHVQYVNQTTLKKRKPKECPWQGKIKSDATVRRTDDWFNRNIEYGQHDWYCIYIEMDKDITTETHGPWYELPGADSISEDDTSTFIPNVVAKVPTSLKTKKMYYYKFTKE